MKNPYSTSESRNVLLSAYACEPGKGSEPAVGWQVLKANLEAGNRVVLLTRANNVRDLRAALLAARLPECRIVGMDLGLLSRIKRYMPGGTQIYYIAWQLRAISLLRRLELSARPDIVHHVTFATDWLISAAAWARGPVVWGPVGGAERCPARLKRYLGVRGRLAEVLRGVASFLGRVINRKTIARRASLVVAQNGDQARALERGGVKAIVEPNVFIDPRDVVSRSQHIDRTTIIGVGRLLPWKGWALAISALTHLPEEYTLEIYGDGPDRSRLSRLAHRLSVEDRVIFHGDKPRPQVLSAMATARCLLHPSFHEAAGAAVAEAAASGCPVVTLDLGGAGEIASRSNGVVVSHREKELERAIAHAISQVSESGGTTRWSSDRLSGLLGLWYAKAGK